MIRPLRPHGGGSGAKKRLDNRPSWRAGARPRAWGTVLALALTSAPRLAFAGLWAVLRGRSMRGWTLLNRAAAGHSRYYERWVERAEPFILGAFMQDMPPVAHLPRIACLILNEESQSFRLTLASVKRALGQCACPIRGAKSLADAVEQAQAAGCAWLLPMQAGDTLSPTLGEALRRTVAATGNDTILYWDEDEGGANGRQAPWIKPDWDPVLFQGRDMLSGAALLPLDRVAQTVATLGDCACDAANLARRIAAIVGDRALPIPRHIPLILTHRKERPSPPPSESMAERPISRTEAGLAWPGVTIIIPTRDQADLVETCLASLDLLTYPGEMEVLIMDNDSLDPSTHALFKRLREQGRARILPSPGPFNFARIMNQAADAARGELLCLLNNDVEALEGQWLTQMAARALAPEAGAVGARLLYPDGSVQHVGVAIGIGGAAGHVQKGHRPDDPRFFTWHGMTRRVSAVTAACLVVARAKFLAVGGMDEHTFAVDFNDVDLCLKLQAQGWINLFVAEATLIHHESKSRGLTRSPEAMTRFEQELAALRARWKTDRIRDPWHSPLFRCESEQCQLEF